MYPVRSGYVAILNVFLEVLFQSCYKQPPCFWVSTTWKHVFQWPLFLFFLIHSLQRFSVALKIIRALATPSQHAFFRFAHPVLMSVLPIYQASHWILPMSPNIRPYTFSLIPGFDSVGMLSWALAPASMVVCNLPHLGVHSHCPASEILHPQSGALQRTTETGLNFPPAHRDHPATPPP